MVGMWSARSTTSRRWRAGVDGTLDHPGVRLVGPGDGAGDQRRRWAARTPATLTSARIARKCSTAGNRVVVLGSDAHEPVEPGPPDRQGAPSHRAGDVRRAFAEGRPRSAMARRGVPARRRPLSSRGAVRRRAVGGRPRVTGSRRRGHHVLTVATVEFEAVGSTRTLPGVVCVLGAHALVSFRLGRPLPVVIRRFKLPLMYEPHEFEQTSKHSYSGVRPRCVKRTSVSLPLSGPRR